MTTKHQTLIDCLPKIRGCYQANADLSKMTWFKVGGPAEVMFHPADVEDLAYFLANRPSEIPITIMGIGSNLLVRDGGLPGITIRLGRSFADIHTKGEELIAGTGSLDFSVAMTALNAHIGGLEFLSGIPGSLGGALCMNAGAYNKEIKDVFVSAHAIDGAGHFHNIGDAEMGFSYRQTAIPDDWIFTEVRLRGQFSEQAQIAKRINDIRTQRSDSQPPGIYTGGSTFTNPPGNKAWKLIDAAGCRGLRHGGAMVSGKHCNFLINTGKATATDLEELGEEIRRRVKESSGIMLEWEIQRIGQPLHV